MIDRKHEKRPSEVMYAVNHLKMTTGDSDANMGSMPAFSPHSGPQHLFQASNDSESILYSKKGGEGYDGMRSESNRHRKGKLSGKSVATRNKIDGISLISDTIY